MSQYDSPIGGSDPEARNSVDVRQSFAENFERDGVTIELAREKATLYRELHHISDIGNVEEQSRRTHRAASLWGETTSEGHPDVLYLNTSDGIETLYAQCDVAGKRVLAIGGSGDVWQMFLLKGASEIEICDISLPGVLWNELKYTALRNFTWEQYQQMCFMEEWDEGRSGRKWLDLSLYNSLRPKLSPQAQTFFDTLCNFPQGDEEVLAHPNAMFLRWRGFIDGRKKDGSDTFGYLQTIGGVVDDEESYAMLRGRAEQTPMHIRRKDITSYLASENIPAVVYVSNVYYNEFETAQLALDFLKAGAERVYMTMVPYDITVSKNADGSLTIIPESGKREKKNKYSKYEKRDFIGLPVGTTIYVDDIKTRFLGSDIRVSCSVMLEVGHDALLGRD